MIHVHVILDTFDITYIYIQICLKEQVHNFLTCLKTVIRFPKQLSLLSFLLLILTPIQFFLMDMMRMKSRVHFLYKNVFKSWSEPYEASADCRFPSLCFLEQYFSAELQQEDHNRTRLNLPLTQTLKPPTDLRPTSECNFVPHGLQWKCIKTGSFQGEYEQDKCRWTKLNSLLF